MFDPVSMSTTASSSAVRRPTTKRAYHTWHSKAGSRSHFEDFLREIGASSQEHQLCCMPRQGATKHHSTGHKTAVSISTATGAGDHVRHSSAIVRPRGLALHGRQETSTSKGTRPYSGRKPSHQLMSPNPRTGGCTPDLKVEPLSAIDFQTYDASDSFFSIDAAHTSLWTLLGHTSDDQQASPMPRSDEYDPDVQMTTEPDHSGSPPRSIRRSPSRDSLSTAPSSEAPATPKSHTQLLPEMHPTLADLEQASRFRVQAVCVTCRKYGSNFPSCSRCGETWCSRECRLKGANGSRHTCHERPAGSHRISTSHDI